MGDNVYTPSHMSVMPEEKVQPFIDLLVADVITSTNGTESAVIDLMVEDFEGRCWEQRMICPTVDGVLAVASINAHGHKDHAHWYVMNSGTMIKAKECLGLEENHAYTVTESQAKLIVDTLNDMKEVVKL